METMMVREIFRNLRSLDRRGLALSRLWYTDGYGEMIAAHDWVVGEIRKAHPQIAAAVDATYNVRGEHAFWQARISSRTAGTVVDLQRIRPVLPRLHIGPTTG